jgi:hypothetical protein
MTPASPAGSARLISAFAVVAMSRAPRLNLTYRAGAGWISRRSQTRRTRGSERFAFFAFDLLHLEVR